MLQERLGQREQWTIRDADGIRVECTLEADESEEYVRSSSKISRGSGRGPRVAPSGASVLCLADALSDDSRSPSKEKSPTGRQQQLALNPEANNWTSTIKNQ